MSDIVEEDENSYEDLEEITAENFDEFSRNDDDLFLPVGDNDGGNNISEDDERKFDEDDEKINILKQVSRFQIILIIIDISYI